MHGWLILVVADRAGWSVPLLATRILPSRILLKSESPVIRPNPKVDVSMTTSTPRLWLWMILGCFLSGLAGVVVEGQDWNRPIPQNLKKQEQRSSDRLTWQRKTLLDAYDKCGKKNPRWDRDAHVALEAAVQFHSRENSPREIQREILDACRRAMTAGCDDPLILLLEVMASNAYEDSGSDPTLPRFLLAVDALEHSPYPAIRKVWALTEAVKVASSQTSATAEQKISRHVDLILKWLPVSLADEGINPSLETYWMSAFGAVIKGRRAVTKDVEETLVWIDEQVKRMPQLKVSWLQARSFFLKLYAWEARGSGTADTVTKDGWEKMNARLAEAKKSIDQAWTLKPGAYLTAYQELNLTVGMDSDRAEMERWFQSAMEANGNGLRACLTKIQWLEPKWHGSDEELIAFGRLCGDTKNWEAGISLLEPECYLMANSEPNQPPGGAFWKSPEVWKRCRAVFEEYLSHRPDDNAQRTRYAVIASLTGHHAEATVQFQKLGKNYSSWKKWGMPPEWVRSIRDASARNQGIDSARR